MITQYLSRQLEKARYRLLEDGTFYAEIPGLSGVWANNRTLEGSRRELEEVLEDWLFLKIRSGDRVPGFSLKVDRRRLVKNA